MIYDLRPDGQLKAILDKKDEKIISLFIIEDSPFIQSVSVYYVSGMLVQ